MKKRLLALLLALAMILVLCACGSSGGVMNETKDDGGSESDTAAVSNGKTYEWKLASAWGEGSRQFEFDERFCDKVEEMSNGRLKIKCYGAGQPSGLQRPGSGCPGLSHLVFWRRRLRADQGSLP